MAGDQAAHPPSSPPAGAPDMRCVHSPRHPSLHSAPTAPSAPVLSTRRRRRGRGRGAWLFECWVPRLRQPRSARADAGGPAALHMPARCAAPPRGASHDRPTLRLSPPPRPHPGGPRASRWERVRGGRGRVGGAAAGREGVDGRVDRAGEGGEGRRAGGTVEDERSCGCQTRRSPGRESAGPTWTARGAIGCGGHGTRLGGALAVTGRLEIVDKVRPRVDWVGVGSLEVCGGRVQAEEGEDRWLAVWSRKVQYE